MFDQGHTYRRRDLHARFRGQERGGISTPKEHPLIFLFTGESGEQFGYQDGWELDGTYRYFGEGQIGDMRLVSGNKAIRDHAQVGKDLHLFRILPKPKGSVRYIGQMVCSGYQLKQGVPDRLEQPREAIAFRLVPLEASSPSLDDMQASTDEARELNSMWSAPIEQLRARAEESPAAGALATQALRMTYRRSEAVRIYVLRRANGHCEGCGTVSPFKTPNGHPYLEPHHTRRLSDGGPDTPAHVIALCPTCHRRAHYAADALAFNTSLIERMKRLVATTVGSA